MRDYLTRLLLLVILVIGGFSSSITAADSADINLCFINKKNPPLVLDPGNLATQKPGVTVEILSAISKRLNVKFNYSHMPWARCLYKLKNNEADAIFHASYTAERRQYGVYPEMNGEEDKDRYLVNQTYYIYKRKGSALEWDGESFSNLIRPVGAIIDFSVVKDLKKNKLEVEEVAGIRANLNKLLSGRIDAFINYASQTDAVLAKDEKFRQNIEKVDLPYRKKIKHLLFSKEFYNTNPELVEQIWHELAMLRSSGQYQKILARYADD